MLTQLLTRSLSSITSIISRFTFSVVPLSAAVAILCLRQPASGVGPDRNQFHLFREIFRERKSMAGGGGTEEAEEPEPPKQQPPAISYYITIPPSWRVTLTVVNG
ncbi:hypothetical protein AAG906_038112 [Vitis piasezkii]